MKKLLVLGVSLVLILMMMPLTALAAEAPPYNGQVYGIITSDSSGVITGTISGDYDLQISGTFTSVFTNQHATFDATVSGDIVGTITGGVYCVNGLDTIYGVIDGTGATEPVRIVGCFLQSGIAGDFAGEIITGALPEEVTSIVINTENDTDIVAAGSTLQCSAETTPAGYDIQWAIYSPSSGGGSATIDQNGLITALETGTIVVIANTLDPSLATETRSLTVVNPKTEVVGSVDPTYIVVIPAAVDFGTLVKDTGTQSQEFPVQASNMVIEDGYKIEVSLSSDFVMKDKDGEGAIDLAYTLYNSVPTAMTTGAVFASFSYNRTETGTMEVDTADITAAGDYKGTIDFIISYVEE